MLEWLLSLDRELFLRINRDWTHPWLDAFFPGFTDMQRTWYFRYIFVPWVFLVFMRQYGKKGIGLFVGLLLTVGTSDFLGGRALKPYFERPRPTVSVHEGVTRGVEYGGYSFPSNHAANSMAMAVYAVSWIPQARLIFIGLALGVSYSRVYVGVHYPLDVIVGALIGILVGWAWSRIFEKVLRERRPGP